nr:MAG TPA: hypothetical protein [Bacteriophage sp.]
MGMTGFQPVFSCVMSTTQVFEVILLFPLQLSIYYYKSTIF